MKRILSLFLFLVLFLSTAAAQELLERLQQLDNVVSVEVTEPDTLFKESYKIEIEQPLDHQNPDGETFIQTVYLSHNDAEVPTVLETEGYMVPRIWPHELNYLFPSNHIKVEHRYFGSSVPEDIDEKWEYLTIWQSANDHHTVRMMFDDIYNGKWVASGISKGGQTTIFYKYFFPDDVDVSVPYVAPLNFSSEEPRIYDHLKTVGTQECRNRITAFQREVLKRYDEMYKRFLEYADSNGYSFDIAGTQEAFEYTVLETSFYAWQWEYDCNDLPDSTATDEELFTALADASSIDLYCDQEHDKYQSCYDQAFSEIGYYGYELDLFEDLLRALDTSDLTFAGPAVIEEYVFNEKQMRDIAEFLRTDADNMLYIYGQYDPWTAPGVKDVGTTNSLIIIKPEGSHRTRIRNLPSDLEEQVYTTLEEWLEITIDR